LRIVRDRVGTVAHRCTGSRQNNFFLSRFVDDCDSVRAEISDRPRRVAGPGWLTSEGGARRLETMALSLRDMPRDCMPDNASFK
jgi:hypothetical protein